MHSAFCTATEKIFRKIAAIPWVFWHSPKIPNLVDYFVIRGWYRVSQRKEICERWISFARLFPWPLSLSNDLHLSRLHPPPLSLANIHTTTVSLFVLSRLWHVYLCNLKYFRHFQVYTRNSIFSLVNLLEDIPTTVVTYSCGHLLWLSNEYGDTWCARPLLSNQLQLDIRII